MRDLAIADVDRHAIEPHVGYVMLAAGIKAAADLDTQVFHSLVVGVRLCGKPRPEFAGKTARRGDAKFAGIRSRAGRDVHDRSGSRRTQADTRQFAIEVRQVRLAHPTQNHVLLDSRPDAVAAEPPCNSSKLTHLP